ncbi:hypothetical protein FISHEDRAFT_69149 [Fistulina hepatica ATCC 64428]|uniref:Uncharacterized protein n=1 Tax=Fistulina hepatica ATCC 64428 TaxID=1128425 RepID=A0A0D7AR72_9AGAR|nr:hypothetical protein FISHEDRAFT_69149 [Fistulina hepatica ATCC 64428]
MPEESLHDEHTIRRVKVNKGAAWCFGEVQDNGEPRVLARAERDYDEASLTTTMPSNDPDGCSEIRTFVVDVQRCLSGEEAMASGNSCEPPDSTDHTVTASSCPASYCNNNGFVATIVSSGRLPTPALEIGVEIECASGAMAHTPGSEGRLSEQLPRMSLHPTVTTRPWMFTLLLMDLQLLPMCATAAL